MPSLRISNYLKEHHVPFETIKHEPAYTAQEIAAMAHISGDKLAKSVMLKIDGRLVMLIEPATQKVDLMAVKNSLGAQWVELAHEYEFQDMFPECDTGAMPPFGELFNVDVYIDELLGDQEEIVFNAGNHSELICMNYTEFEKLVKPKHIKLH